LPSSAVAQCALFAQADAVERAVVVALEYPAKGFDTFIITSPDTIMTQPNAELVAKYFPGVPFKRELGPHESMLSSDKAKRVLGYKPTHSWRNEVIS